MNKKITFILIVLFSALFRITNLDLIEFKIDEASNLLLASLPIFGSHFAPAGILSSAGILNTSFFSYILYPLLLISLKPQTIVFFIALASTLANGFFYLMIRKYYNNKLAIITTLLIAFSPWLIIFSRKIWPPDFIFPLFVILFLSLHKIIIEKNQKFWIPTVSASLFLIQLEIPSVFLIASGGLFLLFQKPKINIRYIFIGFVIGMLPLIPYFYFILQNNCQECGSLLNILQDKLSIRHMKIFLRPFQILNHGNFNFIIDTYNTRFAENFPLTYKLGWLSKLEYLLLPIGAFIFWKKYARFRFLLYSTILLLVFYFLLGIDSFMHYFIIISPLLFLFLGTAFDTFAISKNILLKYASFLLLGFLILYSIIFNLSFFKFIREFGDKTGGDYGLPFYLSWQSKEKEYIKYKNNPDYQQIIISSYIPLYIMSGTSPFSKMVYSYNEIRKNLPLLEEQLKSQPPDPRVLHQLVLFYSAKIPDLSTIDLLREKKNKIAGYTPVYDNIYNLYLQKSFKKAHISQKFGISVEYPEHWDEEAIDDKIIIKASDYNILMEGDPKNFDKLLSRDKFKNATYTTTKTRILNMPVEKIECITMNQEWCGTIYSPIQIYTKTLLISYRYTNNNGETISLKNYNNPVLLFSLKVMDEIISSMRKL